MLLDYIHNGDALEVLKTLPDESVHCCVTSPPYYGLRDYGVDGQLGLEESPDQYIKNLTRVFREVKRVLTNDGTLWVNIGDSFAGSGKGAWGNKDAPKESYVPDANSPQSKLRKTWEGIKPKDLIGIPWMLAFSLRADGWYLRQDVIWEKGNAMPESVRDRCTRSHEYIFMFSKSPKYYYDYEAIKEPAVNGDPARPRGSKASRSNGIASENAGRRDKQGDVGKRTYSGFNERYFSKPPVTMRNKRSVWFVNTKPYRQAHFATFPVDLIEPCILAGCPEGGVVLDPFFGAGTTGVAAKMHSRNYVGIELNPTYCGIAEKRIQDVVDKIA